MFNIYDIVVNVRGEVLLDIYGDSFMVSRASLRFEKDPQNIISRIYREIQSFFRTEVKA